jgi:hypothetical protein
MNMEQTECSETSAYKIHRQVGTYLPTYLPMNMKQSVPKRGRLKFRRRGITQNKAYKIISINYFSLI